MFNFECLKPGMSDWIVAEQRHGKADTKMDWRRCTSDKGEGMKLEERGELIDSFESGGMREIAASARRFSCSAKPTKSDAKRVSDSYASEIMLVLDYLSL